LEISHRLVIFGLALWFCGPNSLRGADVSQLRKQLVVAKEADDKPAIIELNRRIVAIAPNDSDAWENIVQGQFEIEDYDRVGETLEAWQKAVKRPPAAIEDFRGDLAVKLKDYANAERHWQWFVNGARIAPQPDGRFFWQLVAGEWNVHAVSRGEFAEEKITVEEITD